MMTKVRICKYMNFKVHMNQYQQYKVHMSPLTWRVKNMNLICIITKQRSNYRFQMSGRHSSYHLRTPAKKWETMSVPSKVMDLMISLFFKDSPIDYLWNSWKKIIRANWILKSSRSKLIVAKVGLKSKCNKNW